MPIYEYQCPKCGECFEELRGMSDETPPSCPACGHEKTKKRVSAACVKSAGSSGAAACAPGGGFS